MKTTAKQSRILADLDSGRITIKQAARLAKHAKRAAMHKGRRLNRGLYS